jgi:hypothetical protein
LEQVSLSHPNATMHKEWVVSTARLERHSLCSSVTKAVIDHLEVVDVNPQEG